MKLFYGDLHRSECLSSAEDRAKFLDKMRFASLSEAGKEDLCLPASKEEVSDPIQSLKRGKAPRPDDCGPEFYLKKNW